MSSRATEPSYAYAGANYGRRKVHYVQAEMLDFVANMLNLDYVVSRGAIETSPTGLRFSVMHPGAAAPIRGALRRAAGNNPHYALHGLRENAFARLG